MPSDAARGPGTASTVTIIGAGLAGCWLARELCARGMKVTVIERGAGVASGASGNPAGIIKPVASRQASRPESFYRHAFAHLLAALHDDGLADACSYVASGAVQLVRKPFAERAGVEPIDAGDLAERTGLNLHAPAIGFAEAGWLHPAALCRALVAPLQFNARFGQGVTRIEHTGKGWLLNLDDGSTHTSDRVVLASGPAVAHVPACAHLPITAARGQMDRFAIGELPRARTVVTGSSWLVPDGEALWAGATYTRDDEGEQVRAADTAWNRAALDALTGSCAGAAMEARAGVRATLPDRLPCVGPIVPADGMTPSPGLSVLCGFGSRGIVTTAFCARLLADRLNGNPDPLRHWSDLLDPQRFVGKRASRR